MCDPVSEYDSRGGGWYCHHDNTWNPPRRVRCRSCFKRRCSKLDLGVDGRPLPDPNKKGGRRGKTKR